MINRVILEYILKYNDIDDASFFFFFLRFVLYSLFDVFPVPRRCFVTDGNNSSTSDQKRISVWVCNNIIGEKLNYVYFFLFTS